MVFIDFCCVFNTIIPDILVCKLLHLGLSICTWIKDFLGNHSQHIRLGPHTFTSITLNTGAPQGCVLSPCLFNFCQLEMNQHIKMRYRDCQPSAQQTTCFKHHYSHKTDIGLQEMVWLRPSLTLHSPGVCSVCGVLLIPCCSPIRSSILVSQHHLLGEESM